LENFVPRWLHVVHRLRAAASLLHLEDLNTDSQVPALDPNSVSHFA
jgi:hypothetical protein